MIPNSVNPRDYVKEVTLTVPDKGSAEAVLQAHIAQALKEPLPPMRTWEVQSICVKSSSKGGAPFLLWRFSHTVGDGVVLTHIMSKVRRRTRAESCVANLLEIERGRALHIHDNELPPPCAISGPLRSLGRCQDGHSSQAGANGDSVFRSTDNRLCKLL